MTLINISLCLPELDIIALRQKHSIVAVTRRFIVPDRSFALLPCRMSPDVDQLSDQYHSQAVDALKPAFLPADKPVNATHWAKCVFCQQVSEEAIATLSSLTIWTKESLSTHLQNGSLFLSFLRVYALSEPFLIDTEPVCDQLYKFMPLSNYLDVDTASPTYGEDEFALAKKEILEPAAPKSLPAREKNETCSEEAKAAEVGPDESSILESDDWIAKISEVGNSSDGHTFEKLVRKGLITLGFSNSLNKPQVSLDPNATGGAGGLDFYADEPYPLVGECKATASGRASDPATQLHKLAIRWLTDEDFNRSAKLILSAGRIPDPSNQVAISHKMNVIRPETLQTLVELKVEYPKLRISSLEASLKQSPFGREADDKIFSWAQKKKQELEIEAQYLPRRRQIIQTIKELTAQPFHKKRTAFSVVEVRSHHNAKYQPFVTDEVANDMLTELSSPLSNFLGREQVDQQVRFYFKKDMPQDNP